MSRYAERTDVTSDRSRSEIERTLARYGASQFMYGWETGRAVVGFAMEDRRVRFDLPMPDRNDRRFTHTPTRGTRRSETAIDAEYDQEVRQRWRALALVVKAKLEAVAAGITSFEEEFLAHIVLPSGETVGGWAVPQIEEVYRTGKMPPLLPAITSTSTS